MRIGILSLDWDLGIPLALTLRDYGRHDVIAYGDRDEMDTLLNPKKWDNPEPEREARSLLEDWYIPVTDRLNLFVDYCDLVFSCEIAPGLLPSLDQARHQRNELLPLIYACPLPNPRLLVAWDRKHRRLDLGYSPLNTDRTNGIARLSNPQGPIWVGGSDTVYRAVELAWRPVCNTVPVCQVPLGQQIRLAQPSEGIVGGSPLATERLGAPGGHVDTPQPPESRGEGP